MNIYGVGEEADDTAAAGSGWQQLRASGVDVMLTELLVELSALITGGPKASYATL